MTRFPLVSVWVMAAVFGAGSAVAAETPLLRKETTPAPSPAPPRPRAISPNAAAKLTAATPKYDAVAPAKPDESAPDLREIDKPRNTIVRLPRFVVEEEKPPVFKERELLAPPARLELALKKFPGLRFGSFWIFRNDGVALAMLAEEERLERKRTYEELAGLLQFGDPAAHATAKDEVERAFLRAADFGR